jgi:hypothetical protein
MTHRAKTLRCAVLDKAGFGLGSARLSYGVHMILPQQIRASAPAVPLVPTPRDVPMFHREVFAVRRNNPAFGRLAVVSAIETSRRTGDKLAALLCSAK